MYKFQTVVMRKGGGVCYMRFCNNRISDLVSHFLHHCLTSDNCSVTVLLGWLSKAFGNGWFHYSLYTSAWIIASSYGYKIAIIIVIRERGGTTVSRQYSRQ